MVLPGPHECLDPLPTMPRIPSPTRSSNATGEASILIISQLIITPHGRASTVEHKRPFQLLLKSISLVVHRPLYPTAGPRRHGRSVERAACSSLPAAEYAFPGLIGCHVGQPHRPSLPTPLEKKKPAIPLHRYADNRRGDGLALPWTGSPCLFPRWVQSHREERCIPSFLLPRVATQETP